MLQLARDKADAEGCAVHVLGLVLAHLGQHIMRRAKEPLYDVSCSTVATEQNSDCMLCCLLPSVPAGSLLYSNCLCSSLL